MRGTHPKSTGFEQLESVRGALSAAVRLFDELAGDPLFVRLIDAFRIMPSQDRETIVGVLEREVRARNLSRGTERVTGQAALPNPNARLYVRTHGAEAQRSELEQEEMMLAMLRAMRVMRFLVDPQIHAEWLAATRDALAQIDQETRDIVERLIREVLAVLSGEVGMGGPAGRKRTA
jgi:hypothetical protein